MRTLKYNIYLLGIINIMLLTAGYLVIWLTDISVVFSDIIILAVLFSIISITVLIIFTRGQSREPDSQTLHTLLAISLKFLLEMFLAFLWFIIIKKTSLASVLLFFVLYLTFTLFSILIILKTLKNKSL